MQQKIPEEQSRGSAFSVNTLQFIDRLFGTSFQKRNRMHIKRYKYHIVVSIFVNNKIIKYSSTYSKIQKSKYDSTFLNNKYI